MWELSKYADHSGVYMLPGYQCCSTQEYWSSNGWSRWYQQQSPHMCYRTSRFPCCLYKQMGAADCLLSVHTAVQGRCIQKQGRTQSKQAHCIQTIYSVVLGNFGKGNQGSFAIMCSDVHKSTFSSPGIWGWFCFWGIQVCRWINGWNRKNGIRQHCWNLLTLFASYCTGLMLSVVIHMHILRINLNWI